MPGLSDCVKCGWSLCQVQRWFAQGSQQLCARRGRSLRQVHCWFAPGVAGICARFTAGLCQVWPEFAPGSLQVCARCAKSPETGYAYRPSAHFSVPGQRKNADPTQKAPAPGTKNTSTRHKKHVHQAQKHLHPAQKSTCTGHLPGNLAGWALSSTFLLGPAYRLVRTRDRHGHHHRCHYSDWNSQQ